MTDKIESNGKIVTCSTPSGDNWFYQKFIDSEKTAPPIYTAVDWAMGAGFIRGEVIKREGNVTHVRFKTLTLQNHAQPQ